MRVWGDSVSMWGDSVSMWGDSVSMCVCGVTGRKEEARRRKEEEEEVSEFAFCTGITSSNMQRGFDRSFSIFLCGHVR